MLHFKNERWWGLEGCFCMISLATILWGGCQNSGFILKLQIKKLNLFVYFELIGTQRLTLFQIQKKQMGNQNVDVLMPSKGYASQVKRILM